MHKRPTIYIVSGLVAVAGVILSCNAYSLDCASKQWKHPASGNYAARWKSTQLFSSVLIGKTEQEVIDLLGEPDERGFGVCGIVAGKHEILSYNLGTKGFNGYLASRFVVQLKNGRVIKAES